MTDVHSCSYYCDRPECIKAQRDELRDRLAQPEQEQWDAIPDAFNEWWNADYDDTGNPYRKDSPAYWAWSGWKAASKQPEQEPVFDCPRCGHCCPQRKPLTPDQVFAIADQHPVEGFDPEIMAFARAIEAIETLKLAREALHMATLPFPIDPVKTQRALEAVEKALDVMPLFDDWDDFK